MLPQQLRMFLKFKNGDTESSLVRIRHDSKSHENYAWVKMVEN